MALSSIVDANRTGNGSRFALDEAFLNMSDIASFKQPLDIAYIRWIYITLFGMVFLCCVIGNATVIYVILRHKKMRNITNFFLANLAFSDLCVGVFCVLPNLTTFLSPYWVLGRVLCKLYYFIQCTSYTASILILTVISLERYFAIIHPMFNKRVTRMCLLRVVVVVIWLCAALYGTPNLIAYDLYRVPSENATLEFCVTTGSWNIDMEVYSILNFIVLYLLPLTMIVVMYVRISNALWRSGANVALNAASAQRAADASSSSTKGGRLRCPRCKQIVYDRRDGFSARADRLGAAAAADDRRRALLGNGRSTPSESTFGRPSHVSPWVRSVEEATDDETAPPPPPKQCQCGPSSSLVVRKSFVASLRHRRKSRKDSNPLTTRRKVVRLLIFIVLSFAVCVLPHHVRLLWQYWLRPSAGFSFVHMLVPPSTFLFFYANSALNPFLYAFLSEQFRKAFRDLLPDRLRCGGATAEPSRGSKNKSPTRNSMSDIQLQDLGSRTVCRLTSSGVDATTVTECVQP